MFYMERFFYNTLRLAVAVVGLLCPVVVAAQITNFRGQSVRLTTSEKESRVYTQVSSSYMSILDDVASAIGYDDGEEVLPLWDTHFLLIGNVKDLSSTNYGAVWKHNQIPIEMVCSGSNLASFFYDIPFYTPFDDNGRFRRWDDGGSVYINAFSPTVLKSGMVVTLPCCNYIESKDYYQPDNDDGKGICNYFCVSLPKGFRFTGYNIKVRPVTEEEAKTLTDAGDNVITAGAELYFGEASTEIIRNDKYLTYYNATITDFTNEDEGVSITSTSGDYGNNLYFVCKIDASEVNKSLDDFLNDPSVVAFVIEDATFYYEVEGFDVAVKNGTGKVINGTSSSFDNQRLDFGKIYKQKDGDSNAHYGYYIDAEMSDKTSTGLYDSKSDVLFYDGSKVSGNMPTLAEDEEKGTIIDYSDGFALCNGTYYVEAPVSGYNEAPVSGYSESNPKFSIPVGYRITGATVTVKPSTVFSIGDYRIMGDGGSGDGSASLTNNDVANIDHSGKLWSMDSEGRIYNSFIDTKNDHNCGKYYFQNTPYIDKEGKYLGIGKLSRDIYKILDNGVISTTINEKTYYISSNDRSLVEYDDASSIDVSSAMTVTYYYSAADVDENYGGLKVEVYTNSDSSPLVTLTKEKGGSIFSYTDTSSQLTDVTYSRDSVKFTIGDATNAKYYINNDALKIVVDDINGADSNNSYYYANVAISLRLEPLNPFLSGLQVADEDGLNEETVTVVGTQIEKNEVGVNVMKPAYGNIKFTAQNAQSYFTSPSTTATNNSMCGLVKSGKYTEEGGMYSGTASDYNMSSNIPTTEFSYNNLSAMTAALSGEEPEEQEYVVTLFSESGYSDLKTAAFTSTEAEESKKWYVISYDRPAFNLSAATGLRHQSYAYYDEITTNKNEVCELGFKKIYDKTYHYDKTAKADGVDETPYYGGYIKKLETDKTVNITLARINERIENAVKGDYNTYFTTTGVPSKYDHLLYFDTSTLDKLTIGTTGDIYADMRKKMAANAMVYIPTTDVAVADTNVVKNEGDSYVATENIRLKDKEPMFIPTSFTKSADEGYVEYVRNFTTELDGRVSLNTFVLPFALPLSDGVYDGNLKLYTLKSSECLTNVDADKGEGTDYYNADATFTPVTGSTTVANTPYFAVVQKAGTEDDKTFTIKLTDEVEVAKTGTHGTTADDGAIAGGTSTGSVDDTDVTFTSYGTYSGATLPKGNGYFYFGKDKLYSSLNLAETYPNVLVRPFRVYYDFDTAQKGKFTSLGINFDEGGEATDISDIDNGNGNGDKDVLVTVGKGTITVTALTDTNVTVSGVAGQLFESRGMATGESHTMTAASGIYIVNGQKVIVR